MHTLTHRNNVLIWITITVLLVTCRPVEDIVSIRAADPLTASQASLVSILPTGAASAEVVVKSIRLDSSGWKLTAKSADGPVSLMSAGTQTLPDFWLTTLRLSGLTVGQTVQLRLAFRFAGVDSLTALRTYTHRPEAMLRWTRLAHASFGGGDYTGYPVAVDGICGSNPNNGCGNPVIGAYVGNAVQVERYPGPQQPYMDIKQYDRATDRWSYYPTTIGRTPRHGVIQYNLFFERVDRYQFSGLGYIAEERAPGKYFYYHDMSAIFPVGGSPVIPGYGGEDGEVAFFTTTDEAYFLTQNGSPTLRSLHADFTQRVRAPLPELPGTLATFSIRNIGYVVNQRPGQTIRLWAYNPANDTWIKRADFPGAARNRGTGFALARRGYFGLGLTDDGQGLRDLWEYDPLIDRWQYVTDYPGQGNQLLAVFSAPDGAKPERAYLGWGYESQPVSTGVTRIVGCTDWWELVP